MPILNGEQFTQLENLNILGTLLVQGQPVGGGRVFTGNPSDGDYPFVESSIIFEDEAGDEIWRLWATDPNTANYNSANLYIGYEAGLSQPVDNVSAGYYNTGVGYAVLHDINEGRRLTGMGESTFFKATDAENGSAFGAESQFNLETGNNNSSFGVFSLYSNVSSDENSAFGSGALYLATSRQNDAFGFDALAQLTTGERNIGFGNGVMFGLVTGNENTAMGRRALFAVTGDGNTALGYKAAETLAGADYCIMIGHEVVPDSITDDYQMNIGGLLKSPNMTLGHLIVNGMPTSDPGIAGVLWNSAGIVNVSAG